MNAMNPTLEQITYTTNFDRLIHFLDLMYAQAQADIETTDIYPACVLRLAVKYGCERCLLYLMTLNDPDFDDAEAYNKLWLVADMPIPTVDMMREITSFLLDSTEFWQR
jgi:hypothetical protein